MKQFYYLIGTVVLATFLVGLFLIFIPALAAEPAPTPLPVPTAGSPPSSADYLLVLPVIPPEPAEIPSGLSREQAAEYARSLTYRQAQPTLADLARLRAEGSIAGFQVRPDLHGVIVTGATMQAMETLSRLQGAAAVMPYADEPPACAVAAAQALPEQVLGMSRMAASSDPHLRATGLAPQATDPSINANVPPGSTGNTWTYVWGQTTPNTSVTMRILRGGRVIATQSTSSYSGGYYSFYPSWQSCPTSGYNWSLRQGDVVEVTAHGNTVSTVVAYLRAWVDPVTNIVAGKTDPGRSVEVWLYDYSSDPCSGSGYNQIVGTDSGGNFTANFTDQVNFDRKAGTGVYARDANGNSTYYWFDAYRINAYFDGADFWGYLKPEVDFIATLSRTGSIVSTYSGKTDADDYYYGWFTDTIQAGDVIQVSGGGVSIQYTATGLDVALDPTTNQATGTTGPNRLVQAYFYKRDWGYMLTSCSWNSRCERSIADGSGHFALYAGMDLVRGDYAYFYVYDAEGNYQYVGQRPIPAVVADLTWGEVEGYWGDPAAGYLTVTLKDNGGSVKATRSWVWVYSWDGEFSTWMGSTISPTDIIEVTDGAVTETMTVQNLTARLDGGTGHLTGNAASGHLLARLWDFRRDSGYWYSYCSETTVAGPYDFTFSGAQVGGQDEAEVWNSGPDGHYTYRYPHTFTVNAQKGDDYVYGYTETPYTPVTVTLRRGGSPIAIYTATSFSEGYYYALLSGGTPVTITQGDTLQVQAGDGDSASLPIPQLTANADAVNNRVYGKSPASQPVTAQARRHYNWWWYSYSQSVTADGSGNYSASFNGLYWWRDCSAVNVGHRCAQPAAYYYNTAGHMVWVEGPYPPPVGPDVYESDDISTTARAYAGVQSHTFHVYTDTDWITFTVPQADVDDGVPYRIETFNLGWGMATQAVLYDTDGMTLLNEWTGYEYQGRGISVLWTPTAAGTYYLEIIPPWSYYAAYCDAVYDLMILPVRAQVYLPLVVRNY